jgi:glyoxylase-like metal-dependent hydrolase (beta-lactamase superfamily II)
MLKATAVEGNRQRLDGGAMFGNVPRPLWSRWYPPDEEGRIDLACRALLLEDDGRRVLLETGIGCFFEPKLRERFGVFEDRHVLLESLAALGLSDESIDVVVLSHLHFDHAGGLLGKFEPGAALRLLFPKATFVVGEGAWARAQEPHARDRASFIPGLAELLEASGRLEIVKDRSATLGDRYSFWVSNGHTPGMLHTWARGRTGSVFFCADLVPGRAWVHLPITMGYDRYPELLIDEKKDVFGKLRAEDAWLFFTHDKDKAAAKLADENGKYVATAETDLRGVDLDA